MIVTIRLSDKDFLESVANEISETCKNLKHENLIERFNVRCLSGGLTLTDETYSDYLDRETKEDDHEMG